MHQSRPVHLLVDSTGVKLSGPGEWLVNYAERYRAGPRVGTSITEGTANFLVNRRMNKSQQMRWSRRGADLLLQVRCAALNGKLGSSFGQLFDTEKPILSPTWLWPPDPQSLDGPTAFGVNRWYI